MKKILAVFAASLLAPSLYSQGTLWFANDPSTLVQATGANGLLEPVPASGGFVQLMWAPAGTPLSPWHGNTVASWLAGTEWQLVAASKQAIGPLPGRFSAGEIRVETPTPGARIEAAVIGWAGNAASFDEALSRFAAANVSSLFTIDTANPLGTPQLPPPVVGPGKFDGLILEIPEPSSLRVILMFGGGLWLRRQLISQTSGRRQR